jgi:hypothetical protein
VCDRHFYPECGGDTFLPDAGDHSWRVGGMLSAHTLTTWLHEQCSGSHVSLSVRVYHKLKNNSLLSKASRALATEPSRWSKLLIAYGTEQLLVLLICSLSVHNGLHRSSVCMWFLVDYFMTWQWSERWWIDEDKIHTKRGIRTRVLSFLEMKAYPSFQPATGTSSMYMCSAGNDKGRSTQKVILGTSTSSSNAFKLTVL